VKLVSPRVYSYFSTWVTNERLLVGKRKTAIKFGKDSVAARREVEKIQLAMSKAYNSALKQLRGEDEA